MAGDVAGFVACEKYDGRGNVASRAHAAQRDARLQFFLDLFRQNIGHRCFDKSRRNCVHSDVARGDFHGDGFRQADQTGLRRYIVRLPGVAGPRDDRCDIDDAPGASAHHRGQRLLGAQVRTGEVGSKDGLPILLLHAHGQPVASNRGVVHQDVKLAEFFKHGLEDCLYLFRIGNVQFHRESLAALRGNFFHQRHEFPFIACGHRYFRAGLGKCERGFASDALRGARNQCHFVFQTKHN